MVPYLLLTFTLGRLFFAGLSLDRSEVQSDRRMLDRVRVESNVGRAWLNLLRAEPARYDRAVRAQYDQIRACRSDTCRVAPPPVFPPLLYDPLYDRRDDGGDPFMGAYFGRKGVVVRYEE